MTQMARSTIVWSLVVGGSFAALGCGGEEVDNRVGDDVAATTDTLIASSRTTTRFFVPPPNPGALKQIASLLRGRDFENAARLTALEATTQRGLVLGRFPEGSRKGRPQDDGRGGL